ncbi:hypothetical protein D3C86_1649150 [compost metagenome]
MGEPCARKQAGKGKVGTEGGKIGKFDAHNKGRRASRGPGKRRNLSLVVDIPVFNEPLNCKQIFVGFFPAETGTCDTF